MKRALLEQLNAARQERRAAVLVTALESGDQRLVTPDMLGTDLLGDEIDAALRAGKSRLVEQEGKSFFLTVQVPPVRLVVIGAVHISQALAPMAKLAGFDMVIVDPRTAFATPERFPDVQVIAEWPETVLPPMKIDRYTAICCFTHDPKIDDPALEKALRAQCFYVGALGSRKTHVKRVERLEAKGFTPDDIARIRAPIGLDIGAVTPTEIAVSVLGEVILALRKKPLRMETPA
jgi:xanthine dehydrogenase accessory factor